jgi:hypothetical protein
LATVLIHPHEEGYHKVIIRAPKGYSDGLDRTAGFWGRFCGSPFWPSKPEFWYPGVLSHVPAKLCYLPSPSSTTWPNSLDFRIH